MLKLTNDHYIDPDRIAHVKILPAGKPHPTVVFCATFANENIEGIVLSGPEAEEAASNWTRYHADDLGGKHE